MSAPPRNMYISRPILLNAVGGWVGVGARRPILRGWVNGGGRAANFRLQPQSRNRQVGARKCRFSDGVPLVER